MAIALSIARGFVIFTLLSTVAPCVTRYRSVSVDERGQLHIIVDSGKEILPPKMDDQVAFGSPLISPDHQTVGWIVEYPDSTSDNRVRGWLAGRLVVYRNGRIIHAFPGIPLFLQWEFQDEGKRIAYSTGHAHGGARECVLRDVASGRVLARWSVSRKADPPAWAESLMRYE